MKDTYRKAMEIWEVPEVFYEAAIPMYRDHEAELAVRFGRDPVSGQEICRLLREWGKEEAERLLFESYQRNVLEKCQGDISKETFYRMTDFYSRYPYFAQYEPEAYGEFTQETVDRLNEWDLKVYMDRTAQAALAIAAGKDVPMHQTQYLTLQESFDMMDTLGEELIILPCNCKAMGRCTEKPVNVCINKLEKGPNTPYDRKLGTILTLEETKKLIRRINKKGLMQSGENNVLCNCDGIYCYPTKMARILGTRLHYPTSHYETLWDEDLCVQCGKCTKICNFEAFYKDEAGKVKFDPGKCWGCTICSANCPKGAISLKKRVTEPGSDLTENR